MRNLIIKANIPEQNFIENLLNMKHSGCFKEAILFSLGLYALAHSWHIDKLFYYLKLLGINGKF